MSEDNPMVLRDALIIDASGAEPYVGSLLVTGTRIAEIFRGTTPQIDDAQVIDCTGLTLMPGLCDAHTHLSWYDTANFDDIGLLPVEEHVLVSIRNAKTYLDSGYTMCVGAAAGKLRLDVVTRNAITKGEIPGPRYLANGPEISSTGSYIDTGPSHRAPFDFGLIADGPEEVRKHVRKLAREGVDLIKLGLSGEEIVGKPRAEQTVMSDEEVAMATREAHLRGIRVCAHARSAGAVRQCLDHGVDIIYHASFIDDAAIEELGKRSSEFFVVPSLAFILRLAEGAGTPWGLTAEVTAAMGYAREVETAVAAMKKLKAAGVRLLPGGDYGFAWTPHGTYARDLVDFVDLLGFTPMEAIISATRLGGEVMDAADELGRIQAGYLADLLLIDGDPLENISVLTDRDRVVGVMKDGQFHRQPSANRILAST